MGVLPVQGSPGGVHWGPHTPATSCWLLPGTSGKLPASSLLRDVWATERSMRRARRHGAVCPAVSLTSTDGVASEGRYLVPCRRLLKGAFGGQVCPQTQTRFSLLYLVEFSPFSLEKAFGVRLACPTGNQVHPGVLPCVSERSIQGREGPTEGRVLGG